MRGIYGLRRQRRTPNFMKQQSMFAAVNSEPQNERIFLRKSLTPEEGSKFFSVCSGPILVLTKHIPLCIILCDSLLLGALSPVMMYHLYRRQGVL